MGKTGFSISVFLLIGGALVTPAVDANDILIFAGENLCSPRTASSLSYTGFLGFTAGLGVDFEARYPFFTEFDILYVSRRYANNFTIPTFEFPIFAKYELRYLYAGVGPYLATNVGSALSDIAGGGSTTSELGLNALEVGGIAQAGIKFPVYRSAFAFLQGRVSRALNDSSNTGDGFHWAQVQLYIGIQTSFRRGSSSRNKE